jgi:hypothetical protein
MLRITLGVKEDPAAHLGKHILNYYFGAEFNDITNGPAFLGFFAEDLHGVSACFAIAIGP